MVTKTETFTVSRDDPYFDLYVQECTKERGWRIDECTVSVSFTRIERFNAKQEEK